MINVLLWLTQSQQMKSFGPASQQENLLKPEPLQVTAFFSVKAGELHNGATYGPGAAGPFKNSIKPTLRPTSSQSMEPKIKAPVQSHWAFMVSFRVCRKIIFT